LPPNRWRAACLDTPKAAAIRFQLRPCARACATRSVSNRLIPPGTFGSLGDCAQVGEVFHARRFRIEFIGECLEPAGGLLDLGVCVLHVITSSSEER
jgi:hypothetical protein